jgi:hypothetical protein
VSESLANVPFTVVNGLTDRGGCDKPALLEPLVAVKPTQRIWQAHIF